MTGLLFCPDHWSCLHISNKAVSLDLCIHWSGTFNFLQEYFFCIYNLTNRRKRPRFQPVSAFNVPSSLGLVISSLWFMVRDHASFFCLDSLRPLLGHSVHVYSVVSDSWRPRGLCVACQSPLFMNFPGSTAGVGCHFLLQGIFLTQGLNTCLLHWHIFTTVSLGISSLWFTVKNLWLFHLKTLRLLLGY